MPRTSARLAAQRMSITRRNAASSPLLRLPPELRNMIYSLVLGDIPIIRYSRRTTPLNLLYTCHQIYGETALLPYKLNVFNFTGGKAAISLQAFLKKRTPAQIKATCIMRAFRSERLEPYELSATEWARYHRLL